MSNNTNIKYPNKPVEIEMLTVDTKTQYVSIHEFNIITNDDQEDFVSTTV